MLRPVAPFRMMDEELWGPSQPPSLETQSLATMETKVMGGGTIILKCLLMASRSRTNSLGSPGKGKDTMNRTHCSYFSGRNVAAMAVKRKLDGMEKLMDQINEQTESMNRVQEQDELMGELHDKLMEEWDDV